MNTTIEVIYYKYKALKNNEFPIKLRITQNRKRRYINLGVFTKLEHWDFTKNKPKPNCPNREHIEQIIANKTAEFRRKILELKSEDKEFTPTSLIHKVKSPVKARTVNDLFLSQIESLKRQKRTGYAMSHLEVYNSLIKFN